MATIAEIIEKKSRSVTLSLALLIGLLGISLTTYTLSFFHRRAFDHIYNWVTTNKERIEEALFLKNTRALFFRMDQLQESSDQITLYEVSFFDLAQNRITGTLPYPTGRQIGFRNDLRHLAVIYQGPLEFAGSPIGYVYVRGEIRAKASFIISLLALLICSLLFWAIRTQVRSLLTLLSDRILFPIVRLTERMRRLEVQDRPSEEKNESPALEVAELYNGYAQMVSRLKDYAEVEKQRAEAETGFKLATQVAHDIRSPLAALKVAAETISKLPEDERRLLQLSIHRIEEIASNLLQAHRLKTGGVHTGGIPFPKHSELLLSLVESILWEKRAEFTSLKGLRIEFKATEKTYPLFSLIHGAEFKRILSNIINNSVEALADSQGTIQITLKRVNQSAQVKIQDSGKGIPADVLPRLMQRGFSHGKTSGSGLGLYHAQERLKEWNGRLEIRSEPNQGCEVTLELPLVAPPSWFLPEINLKEKSKIVVVDDDISVHQLWETRFKKALPQSLELYHFYSPEEFERWFSALASPLENSYFFLIDFHFQGSATHGLELIVTHQLQKKSALVTSQNEESTLQQSCVEQNIFLIPKSVVGFIPVVLSS